VQLFSVVDAFRPTASPGPQKMARDAIRRYRRGADRRLGGLELAFDERILRRIKGRESAIPRDQAVRAGDYIGLRGGKRKTPIGPLLKHVPAVRTLKK